jgi:hypothetical protein
MTFETLRGNETETVNLILRNQNWNLMTTMMKMKNCGNLNLNCCYWRLNVYDVSGT